MSGSEGSSEFDSDEETSKRELKAMKKKSKRKITKSRSTYPKRVRKNENRRPKCGVCHHFEYTEDFLSGTVSAKYRDNKQHKCSKKQCPGWRECETHWASQHKNEDAYKEDMKALKAEKKALKDAEDVNEKAPTLTDVKRRAKKAKKDLNDTINREADEILKSSGLQRGASMAAVQETCGKIVQHVSMRKKERPSQTYNELMFGMMGTQVPTDFLSISDSTRLPALPAPSSPTAPVLCEMKIMAPKMTTAEQKMANLQAELELKQRELAELQERANAERAAAEAQERQFDPLYKTISHAGDIDAFLVYACERRNVERAAHRSIMN